MPKEILVIDDDLTTVRLIESRLKAYGYKVHTAFDGQEGLEKAGKANPDLIILDVMMPRINGYTLCGYFKLNQKHKDTPIIIITSRKEDVDKEFAGNFRPECYLTKPFDMEELIKIVKELVGV